MQTFGTTSGRQLTKRLGRLESARGVTRDVDRNRRPPGGSTWRSPSRPPTRGRRPQARSRSAPTDVVLACSVAPGPIWAGAACSVKRTGTRRRAEVPSQRLRVARDPAAVIIPFADLRCTEFCSEADQIDVEDLEMPTH